MSDTPQCDDWFGEAQDFPASAFVVSIENARTLERDNARLQARVGELEDFLRVVILGRTPEDYGKDVHTLSRFIANARKLLEDK